MPNLPTPFRAALGLAATAVDEARKLPETLPQAVTTVPMIAVSTAMQASMKVQQHIAMLAARGDEVLSQLRGRSAEPPSWATFDDAPSDPAAGEAGYAEDTARYANGEPQVGKAAFDRIDYDHTGFAEGDEGTGRWDAVGVGGTETEAGQAFASGIPDTDSDSGVTATPPAAAGPTAPAPGLADAVSAPGLSTAGIDTPDGLFPPDPSQTGESASVAGPAKARGSKAAAKAAAPRKAGPAKAGPAKSEPAKAGPAKTGPAKAGPAKAEPAKAAKAPAKAAKAPAKRAGRKTPDHEPLAQAAKKAKPSAAPNPSTMAAEILQAHEAANDDE